MTHPLAAKSNDHEKIIEARRDRDEKSAHELMSAHILRNISMLDAIRK